MVGEADLVFYYYESLRAVQISAQNFSSFLDEIVKGEIEQVTETVMMPGSLFTEYPPIWKRRTYQELTLVGHSEGAVVVRRALLDRLAALERKVASELRLTLCPTKSGNRFEETGVTVFDVSTTYLRAHA